MGHRFGRLGEPRRLIAAAVAPQCGQPLECLAELARDDPHLVRVALRDLRQRLQVLVREQGRVGLGRVDRVERRLDRLRLALRGQKARGAVALGAQDARLPFRFRLQDHRLLLPLRLENLRGLLPLGGLDGRLALAFSREDDRALVAVGAHLLLHRVLDGRRRIDRLDLHACDPDAPGPGGFVEHTAQLRVDLVPAGQRLLEVQRPDDADRPGGEHGIADHEVPAGYDRVQVCVGDGEDSGTARPGPDLDGA